MILKDAFYKINSVLKRTVYLSSLAVIFSFAGFKLHGMCPTVCKDVSDFCYIDKRMNAKPIIVDAFVEDEGPYGIVAEGVVKGAPPIVLKPEEEVEQILEQNPSELQDINIGEILADLQKEADVYLGEDYGIGPKITLEESIYLALRDNEGVGFGDTNINEGITTAYLNREQQMETLKVQENQYLLNFNVTLPLNFARTHFRDRPQQTAVTLPAPGFQATQRLKTGTGAGIGLTWTNSYVFNKPSGRPSDTVASTTLGVSLTQPLLKGAGFFFGTLPLTQAYLNEESNINNLKGIVISVVTETIANYYAYKQAIDQFNIDRRSIEEARQDLEKTKLLVEAGIRARADIVEGEYSLATREFSFQDSQSAVDQARIAFLRVLNMDLSLNIVPADLVVPEIEPKDLPTIGELVAIAYLNSPDYLNQLISLRQAEMAYIVARNDCLWDLSFNAGITSSATRTSLGRSNQNAWDFRDRTVNAGLTLTIPINSLASEAGLIDAKINLRVAKIDLQKREQDMTSNIKNNLRDIKKNIIQLKLAKVNVLLSKQRLVQKRIEIDAGISSSFELTSILDQFIQTETEELNAKINLMNSLASMDALLGTTLDTWNVDINRRTDNLPKLSSTLFGKLNIDTATDDKNKNKSKDKPKDTTQDKSKEKIQDKSEEKNQDKPEEKKV
ncbi:hypothetical protein AYO37_00065 [Opitutia bacterium SCGC AG-212-L18]|nr:hypothetical protein AYO37_00025 [Opitutae bacterium SCGC AG-212-L18]OAI51114.1 hypothetical protein AYO37_00065 [Opitutae bacterium SCGC AG-212-L18]